MGSVKISNALRFTSAAIDANTGVEERCNWWNRIKGLTTKEQINNKILNDSNWNGRIPTADFHRPHETPAQVSVSADDVKSWLGETIYTGTYFDIDGTNKKRKGRCWNNEMRAGVIHAVKRAQYNGRSSIGVFIVYPASNGKVDVPIADFVKGVHAGHIFTRRYLEATISGGLEFD